jgi:hypothetical protein
MQSYNCVSYASGALVIGTQADLVTISKASFFKQSSDFGILRRGRALCVCALSRR